MPPPTDDATEPSSEPLVAEELAALDRLLTSARRFHHLAWLGAAVAVVTAAWPIFVPDSAARALLLGVVALAAASDKLFRTAYPLLVLDTRRPSFAWVATASGAGRFGVATVWILAPVAVAGVSTALGTGAGPYAVELLLAPLVLTLVPRSADTYAGFVQRRRDETGEGIRFSNWLLYVSHLAKACFLGAFLVLAILIVVPFWPSIRVGLLGASAIGFFGSWFFGAIVRLSFKSFDRYGARLGFMVWQSEIPAAEFAGKQVSHALKTFGARYDILTLEDEPAGKLRLVSFPTTIDGDSVEVRVHLKYNPKKLFSAERTWDQATVLEAEIQKLEYIAPGQKAARPAAPRGTPI